MGGIREDGFGGAWTGLGLHRGRHGTRWQACAGRTPHGFGRAAGTDTGLSLRGKKEAVLFHCNPVNGLNLKVKCSYKYREFEYARWEI